MTTPEIEDAVAIVPVRDIDALYAQLKRKLDRLPEGRVRPPFNQDYGMREFHVKDPDGCLLFFGEDAAAVSK